MLEGCYCGRCRPDLIGNKPRISSEEVMDKVVKDLSNLIIKEIDKAIIEDLLEQAKPKQQPSYFDIEVIQISAEELVEMDLNNRKRDLKLFEDNPDMKMPVFVGRGNPKFKVKWNKNE